MLDTLIAPKRRAKGHRHLAWLVGIALILPGLAAAQRSEITELWRELDVVRRQWRAERAVLVTDADRFRARRARRRWQRGGAQRNDR